MPTLKQVLDSEGRSFKKRRIKRPLPYNQPHRIEETYRKELYKIVRLLKTSVQNTLFPMLPGIVGDYKAEQATIGLDSHMELDGYVEDLDAATTIINGDNATIANSGSFTEIAQAIGVDVSEYSLVQHTKVLKSAIGVAPVSSEPWLAAKEAEFVDRNVKFIKDLQNQATKDIAQIVQNGVKSGLRVEEIRTEITRKIGLDTLNPSTFKMSVANRATLIAQDQVLSYYAELNRARQENAGIEKYIWRTANDERVRGNPNGLYPNAKPSHFVMDGKLCSWNDRTVYSSDNGKTWGQRSSIGGPDAHPGEPIRDRCYAEPYFDDILK